MKLAHVSHHSRNEATPTRGAVASPRDYNRSLPPPITVVFSPVSAIPAPNTFEQLRTRVERVSGARDDIVTMLGRMEREALTRDDRWEREYTTRREDERGWLKRETAKRVRLGERTSLDKRAAAAQERDGTRFIRYGKTKLVGTKRM